MISSGEAASIRWGEAIKACVNAEGGWMDWSSDGSVRFLNRDANGRVGVFFSSTVKQLMREHRDDVRVYIDFEKDRMAQIELQARKSVAPVTRIRKV